MNYSPTRLNSHNLGNILFNMSQLLAKALAQLDYLLENFHTLSQVRLLDPLDVNILGDHLYRCMRLLQVLQMIKSTCTSTSKQDCRIAPSASLVQAPREAQGSILAVEKENQAPSVPVASVQHESTSAKPQQKTTKADKKAAKQAKSPIKVAAESEGSLESALADTFAKARLVVGIVRSVEELDNSDKLYR